jgi:hypothetical protein
MGGAAVRLRRYLGLASGKQCRVESDGCERKRYVVCEGEIKYYPRRSDTTGRAKKEEKEGAGTCLKNYLCKVSEAK